MPLSTALDTPVIQIHFSYFNDVGKIQMASTVLDNHGEPDSLQSKDDNNGGERLNMLQPSMIRAVASRASLILLQNMTPQPLAYICRILCYPAPATLTLVAAIFENPSELQAHLDVTLIGGFIRFLEKLKLQERCDVQKILDGCSKLYKIALNAVGAQRYVLRSQDPGSPQSSISETWNQGERLRPELSQFDDHMQLAQSFMSNMPTLCAKSANVFEILQMHSNSKDDYGPFVSEALKPEKYNFEFGPH